MRQLGVIGGTGLDQLPDLVIEQRHAMETPYGCLLYTSDAADE